MAGRASQVGAFLFVLVAVSVTASAEPAAVPSLTLPAGLGQAPAGARLVIRPLAPLERTRLALVAPVRIRQHARDSVRNGMLIGAIAGAAYGVFVVSLIHAELSGPSGYAGVILTSTASGAGLGALVDYIR